VNVKGVDAHGVTAKKTTRRIRRSVRVATGTDAKGRITFRLPVILSPKKIAKIFDKLPA